MAVDPFHCQVAVSPSRQRLSVLVTRLSGLSRCRLSELSPFCILTLATVCQVSSPCLVGQANPQGLKSQPVGLAPTN